MSTLNITGTAVNAAGIATSFTGTITTLEAPVIDGVAVSPQSAPIGTLRTITISAHDPQGQALTYTCQVSGVNATPTGQPNVFTFVA